MLTTLRPLSRLMVPVRQRVGTFGCREDNGHGTNLQAEQVRVGAIGEAIES